jgi:4'-phosphopantetheinyl transferase
MPSSTLVPVAALSIGPPDSATATVYATRGDDARPLDTSSLDAGERAQMSEFRRDADRRRYGRAHVELRLLLAERLDVSARSLRFERRACPSCGGPHGRPVLAGWSQPPVEFSLSHGGGIVLIAVADEPVGVDVEPEPDGPIVAALSARLHPRERELLARVDPSARPAEFARIWVRKEAHLKALGTGLADGLGTADCSEAPAGWRIVDRRLDARHHAAVAIRSRL